MKKKHRYTLIYTAAVFTLAKIGEQLKCPSTDEWIKDMWHIYTTEYYSVMRKKGILPIVTMWIDLEHIMLSEISQRHVLYNIAYTWDVTKVTPVENRVKWWLPGEWGGSDKVYSA